MTAYLVTILGAIAAIVGGVWAGSIFRGLDIHNASALLAAVSVATPGIMLLSVGLILVALGSVLQHLYHIERNTAHAARALDEIARR